MSSKFFLPANKLQKRLSLVTGGAFSVWPLFKTGNDRDLTVSRDCFTRFLASFHGFPLPATFRVKCFTTNSRKTPSPACPAIPRAKLVKIRPAPLLERG